MSEMRAAPISIRQTRITTSLSVMDGFARLKRCFHFGFSDFRTKFQVMDG